MDIVYRLEPQIGFYEVVKYLDPRLLQVQFYKTECLFSSNRPLYFEGHDISGNLIYNMIEKNGKSLYLLLTQTRELEYYLTFVEKESQESYSVLAGENMECAVYQYLEEVSSFGGGETS